MIRKEKRFTTHYNVSGKMCFHFLKVSQKG